MPIEAVIFDMDGVLIDSEHLWQQSEQELFRELGFEITDSMLSQTKGLVGENMISHWAGSFQIEKLDNKSLLERYDGIMLNYMRESIELMDGAIRALDFFTEKGLALGLATNSPASFFDIASEKFKLGKYFQSTISASSDNLPGKPHPAVYLRTAQKLEMEPKNCLVIEDSFTGMVAALSARMKVWVMPDEREKNQPRFFAADEKLGSLNEINDELFTKLLSK